MKNRCMYLGKQVHPFDKTGAPVWTDRCTRSGEGLTLFFVKNACRFRNNI